MATLYLRVSPIILDEYTPLRKPFFSWREALLESNLAPTAKHVLLTLACHMNDLGNGCFPSTKTLARQTGLSERSVCTHLKEAKKAGWIVARARGLSGQAWKHHEYLISWPQGTEGRSAPSTVKALKDVQRVKAQGTERRDVKALKDVQSSTSVSTSVGQEPAKDRQAPSNGALSQREFSDAACRLFSEKYHGERPTWVGKDYAGLARLLGIHPGMTVEVFASRYTNFLNSPTPYHQEQGGSLAFFCSKYDSFINSVSGRSYVNKAQQRELDNKRAAQGAVQRGEERDC
jgi:hypothetical protein